MSIQTTVHLTEQHRKLIDNSCLSLTKFVRMALDEHFSKLDMKNPSDECESSERMQVGMANVSDGGNQE